MVLKYPYMNTEYSEFANQANKAGKVLVKQTNRDVEMVNPPPVPIPEPPVPSDEVLALREEYRTSTRSVCMLAGVSPVDKLTDVEYKPVVMAALSADPVSASFLTQTISYCLFQLYRLDGNDAWNRI